MTHGGIQDKKLRCLVEWACTSIKTVCLNKCKRVTVMLYLRLCFAYWRGRQENIKFGPPKYIVNLFSGQTAVSVSDVLMWYKPYHSYFNAAAEEKKWLDLSHSFCFSPEICWNIASGSENVWLSTANYNDIKLMCLCGLRHYNFFLSSSQYLVTSRSFATFTTNQSWHSPARRIKRFDM